MKCYFMPIESRWLLAVLNTDLIEFMICQITNSLRGGFLELNTQYTTRLPIIVPNLTTQRILESYAQAGIVGDPVDDGGLNEVVYDLYGLSRKEAALVGEWFERRSLGG